MTFASMAYFIVRRMRANALSQMDQYLSLPGEWSNKESDAMRFPQRALAESYARRFGGEVKEVRRYEH